ncbi:23S rRNA methylase [Halovivax ruber XH-70]|uniref:Ribosomal RNA large subunit methyltransferase E n=1 Tax=Halovivax ruber (strain DSM 18193 / JCM 13892 / XH-70) TaxID=797302 RepID=L0IF14_HALRX|nr:23S rRNA (uridine(2552)-2'-O)-methyltransferase [Halovivax ruber]AGB17428.1 23S rRNA methylase [Halovivax ruber XH-70]
MTGKDHYYNKAKQEGYRARSAYKLQQLDDLEGLIDRGDTVLDLGAAPGGWLQVAAERVGPEGTVIGVDFQRIDGFDDEIDDRIETLRGDVTEAKTLDRIRRAAGASDGESNGERGAVDVVLSDMAPNVTGEYSLDQARSLHLARTASEVALELLETGGTFAAKVFEGPDVDDFRADLEDEFQYVRATVPKATRDESSELYLLGIGRLTAPVSAGDEHEVEIVDTGSEGDGIATVEGFRLFVPDAEPGETVRVRVDDVKPHFGFAERIDD